MLQILFFVLIVDERPFDIKFFLANQNPLVYYEGDCSIQK